MLVKVESASYRTIAQCYEIIKKIDPDTAISTYFIRGMCRNSEMFPDLVAIPSGNKVLIQLSSLFKTLHIEYSANNEIKELEGA